MVKLFKKEKILFIFLFIIMGIFCDIFFAGEKTIDNDVISASLSANYIALILNNLYILYMFFKTKKVKGLYDKIICRIGQKKFFNSYITNSLIDILLYMFITYSIIYLKLGINLNYIVVFIIFLALSFCNFLFQELISNLTFFTRKGSQYIIYPIMMNLLFHYYIVPLLVSIFSNQLGGI